MKNNFTRHDFLIKDLAVSIPGGNGSGGTWMPTDDQHTPPTPISPIASVLVNIGLIEAVRGTVAEAAKAQKFDDVARAFVPGEAGGSPVIRTAIQQIGSAVVASAAYAAFGATALVDGERSLATIPTPITPVVHTGFQIHQVTELPRLRKQLQEAVDYVNQAAAAQAPTQKEVDGVRAQLKEALNQLQ
jgi:hypothetical protein